MATLTDTPIDAIDPVLRQYDAGLESAPMAARQVWHRIAASRHAIGGDTARWHRDAVALCEAFAMTPRDREPQISLSWTGSEVAALTEPAVLIHEVAHFQLASPSRRFLPDFGLGAGPESGDIALAESARRLDEPEREIEEQRTSLLGIIWEAELGQPAILAFQEQNWLEGAGRPSTAAFFVTTLNALIALGLVDSDGHPLLALRCSADRAIG